MTTPVERERASPRRHLLHGVTVLVAVAGVVVVGVLAWVTGVVNSHTQAHLLGAQTRAAALVLSKSTPSIEAPLEAAATIMETGGTVTDVERYVGTQVGPHARRFDSFSLWRETASGPREMLSLGLPAALGPDSSRLGALFAEIRGPQSMAVMGLLAGVRPQIAVAEESAGPAPRYFAYGELPLSPSRRGRAPRTPAFQDLEYALYFGRHPSGGSLLLATAPLPFHGHIDSAVISIGQGDLLFVDAPTAPLGGGILPVLPWLVGVVGAAVVIGAAITTEWLGRRRRVAEWLANENHRLYAEQRTIAQGLQRALLPDALPAFEGIELAACYVPGDEVAEIGGDWYDVIRCDAHSLIFTVGDVSGRGVPAANTMASLHFAIRAYAAQGDSAPVIMEKLTALLDVARDGHFATVLLGHVDIRARQATLVSAGHLPPLLAWGGVGNRDAKYLETRPGSPIGVSAMAIYEPVTVSLPPAARLLAYTDGMVERRGEHLDVGLERLRQAVVNADDTDRQMLDRLVRSLTGGETRDDIALLEIRWTN